MSMKERDEWNERWRAGGGARGMVNESGECEEEEEEEEEWR